MENIANRIKELIDDQGLSNTDFAKQTNINPAIISHILSGRNKPSLQVVNQIKDSFTNVNIEYLITGDGSLYKDFTNVKTKDQEVSAPSFGQVSAFPMEGVRVVSEPGTKPSKAEYKEEINQDSPREKAPSSIHIEKKDEPIKSPEPIEQKEVEQIVIFYKDGSFKAYRP